MIVSNSLLFYWPNRDRRLHKMSSHHNRSSFASDMSAAKRSSSIPKGSQIAVKARQSTTKTDKKSDFRLSDLTPEQLKELDEETECIRGKIKKHHANVKQIRQDLEKELDDVLKAKAEMGAQHRDLDAFDYSAIGGFQKQMALSIRRDDLHEQLERAFALEAQVKKDLKGGWEQNR